MKIKANFRKFQVILIAILVSNTSCKRASDITDVLPTDSIPQLSIDNSKMFGLNELPQVIPGIIAQSDSKVTPELVANMCKAMGVNSFRMNIHFNWIFTYNDNGELIFIQDNIQKFRDYVTLLTNSGVKNILIIGPVYMYPYGHERSHWRAIPDPGTELYIQFLDLISQCYKMLAEEFPNVNLFEPGNEISAPNGHNLNKQGFDPNRSLEENAPYIFDNKELAKITADICYYAKVGVKSVNSKAEIVLPGIWTDKNTPEHLDAIYNHIKSGKMPSSAMNEGKRKLGTTTNPDDYFNYLNWHPYIHGEHTLDWLDLNESIYNVALKHGDVKKVLITEFGYWDTDLQRRKELIAKVCIPAMLALKDRIKNIETFYIFRLFNYSQAGSSVDIAEKTYGIFGSPNESTGIVPKPIAISLFYHFNGLDANSDALFRQN